MAQCGSLADTATRRSGIIFACSRPASYAISSFMTIFLVRTMDGTSRPKRTGLRADVFAVSAADIHAADGLAYGFRMIAAARRTTLTPASTHDPHPNPSPIAMGEGLVDAENGRHTAIPPPVSLCAG